MKLTSPLKSIFSLTLEQLTHIFEDQGLKTSGALAIYKSIYKQFNFDIDSISPLATESVRFIKENFSFSLPRIVSIQKSSDLTVKFLMEMEDGQRVETVLIPFLIPITKISTANFLNVSEIVLSLFCN